MHYKAEQGTVSDGPCILIVFTMHALVDAAVDSLAATDPPYTKHVALCTAG